MIYIVWRGLGILVPIFHVVVFLLVGWIGGFHRPFSGPHAPWCFLFNGIVFSLWGLVLLSNNIDPETGKISWKVNHSFLYIPVGIGGIIFLAVSGMILFG